MFTLSGGPRLSHSPLMLRLGPWARCCPLPARAHSGPARAPLPPSVAAFAWAPAPPGPWGHPPVLGPGPDPDWTPAPFGTWAPGFGLALAHPPAADWAPTANGVRSRPPPDAAADWPTGWPPLALWALAFLPAAEWAPALAWDGPPLSLRALPPPPVLNWAPLPPWTTQRLSPDGPPPGAPSVAPSSGVGGRGGLSPSPAPAPAPWTRGRWCGPHLPPPRGLGHMRPPWRRSRDAPPPCGPSYTGGLPACTAASHPPPTALPRKSPRLARRPPGQSLDLAIARKAALTGGPCSSAGMFAAAPSHVDHLAIQRIKKKSALCGVLLSDPEADDLRAFIGSPA